MPVRRVARPLLALMFVAGGLDTLRNVEPKAEKAKPLAEKVGVPEDKLVSYTRADAAVKVGAGIFLARGWFPRLSALALAVGLVPTTIAGHPFWRETDKQARTSQRNHFLKNLSLLGGLLLAVADTGGRESIPHRISRQKEKIGS